MIEENYNPDSNGYIITNKSCIEAKPALTEEAKDEKDLQFLYQIISPHFPLSKLKKDLNAFLENGQSIINLYMSSILLLSKRIENNNISQSTLYKNKMISFKNNLDSFHKKLNFIREKNKKISEVLEFIKELFHYDFFLVKDFDIKENDAILDFDKIVLHYRIINNFQNLININGKNFKICSEKNKYKITSDFYEYYNNKYSLVFYLGVKTNRIKIDFSNDMFDNYFKNNNEFDANLYKFYLEYLLYKFLKEEINACRKYFSNSKISSFEYKGLTFTIEKAFRKYTIKCSYFDNLEIIFSISKNNKDSKDISYINSRTDDKIKEGFYIFRRNIFHDIKYSKYINNFLIKVKRNQNLSLDNLTKSSILIKNLSKLGISILRNELNKIIFEESKKLNIISLEFLSIYHYFGKYQLYFDFFERGSKMSYVIHLYFDNNLNLTINVKEPYLNHVYALDNSQRYCLEKGKVNFNSLFRIIKNAVPFLDSYNYKDISIKILSI